MPVTRGPGYWDVVPTSGPSKDSRQRRAQVRRRRLVALGVVLAILVIAIVVPIVSQGGGEEASLGDQNSGDSSSTGADASEGGLMGSGEAEGAAGVSSEGLVSENTAKALAANELGLIPILLYTTFTDDSVPAARLRQDIDRLAAADFYPTTIKDMVQGTMSIPAGKSPIILTFDYSHSTQYRLLASAAIDPDCAIGVLRDAARAGYWPSRGTFFPLLEASPEYVLFGQPQYAKQKLRDLADWGYEIGSHATHNKKLSAQTSDQVRSELGGSTSELERLIGDGYEVFSLAPPSGELPSDPSLVVSGEYAGTAYTYQAVVMSSGGYSPSPFSGAFDQFRIPRIDASARKTVPDLISYFQNNPGLRYVSDGDLNTVSVPRETASTLGVLRSDLGLRVVIYQ